MDQIDFEISKMNSIVNLLWKMDWMSMTRKEKVHDEKWHLEFQSLFDYKMPLDLVAFYKEYGELKSQGFVCPMDLRLNPRMKDSIGLVDELNSFFGGDYFQASEEYELINRNFKCVGRMWPEDNGEEIHCLYYDVLNLKYGRFYYHQDNGQDIDQYGLKYLLDQNKKFATMADLVANEIVHLESSYLALSYECYEVKDVRDYLDTIVEVGLFEAIKAYIFNQDHQPWLGIDNKVSEFQTFFSKEEIKQLNENYKTVGWHTIENENLEEFKVIFVGRMMNNLVFESNDLNSLSYMLKNIELKEEIIDVSQLLLDVKQINCVFKKY